MDKKKFNLSILAILIIGLMIIFLGINIYSKSYIVHPDAVITVHNDTTNKNTQAYAVGKMQIYIDETYRMDMPVWSFYVKTQGENNSSTFKSLDTPSENLSLIKDDNNNNPNPFIMKLKIKNISKNPIYINANNFKIRDVNNNIYSPNKYWQDVLADAGMFSGTKNQNEIKSDEEKVLWLVYGTPSQETKDNSIYQEYVRINYDSDIDLLSTKVEFPFNFTVGYPIGDFDDVSNAVNEQAIIIILIWIGIVGAIYFKLKEKLQ